MSTNYMNPSEILTVWDINFQTGQIYWKIKPKHSSIVIGQPCTNTVNGYMKVVYKTILYYQHQLIFAAYHGYYPEEVDHLNRVRSDNVISNLLPSTRHANSLNQSIQSRNQHGHTGIKLTKYNSWQSYIINDGTYVHLGTFKTKDQAIAARQTAEQLYGFRNNSKK